MNFLFSLFRPEPPILFDSIDLPNTGLTLFVWRRSEHQVTSRIFCDAGSECARDAFCQEGLPLASDLTADMLWIRKNYEELYPALHPFQLINHFPNEEAMINKGFLTENLKRHDASPSDGGMSLSDFYQESYRLYDPTERQAFFSQLPKIDRRDNLWIYKPGNESRGRGIEIMWRFGKMERRYRKLGNQPITDPDQQGIIQRYIRNPLLLDGRKSEIRIYWVVANLDPFLVLMYPEGTVRLNSLPFQLDDFDNQLIHVTNVYQQKNHPNYDPSVVLKWRFNDLATYLNKDLGVAPPDFIETELIPQLRRILAWVARAAHSKLSTDYPKQGDCFGVYGTDIILDDQLHPWLTEIQKGPGLSFDDPVKRHVIPPMLAEAARIVFEVQERRIDGKSLHDLRSVERYQWVINDLQPVEFPEQNPRFRSRSGSPTPVASP